MHPCSLPGHRAAVPDATNPLQNVGSPWRYPIEIALDYGAALPYIAHYRNTNAVGRCDESAQSVMQDPLCARALPYQSDKEKSDDRYTLPLRVVSTLAVLGILFAPVHAVAQVAVGTLVGSVRDDTGGGVPGATVTATETRTNITRTASPTSQAIILQ
jgi:hypothetical protein